MAQSRHRTLGFCSWATFIFIGALFALVGIKAQSAVVVARFRGAVSLAVPLGDPATFARGNTYPGRGRPAGVPGAAAGAVEHRERLAMVHPEPGNVQHLSRLERREAVALRLALLERKRDVMIDLRHRHAISDTAPSRCRPDWIEKNCG